MRTSDTASESLDTVFYENNLFLYNPLKKEKQKRKENFSEFFTYKILRFFFKNLLL